MEKDLSFCSTWWWEHSKNVSDILNEDDKTVAVIWDMRTMSTSKVVGKSGGVKVGTKRDIKETQLKLLKHFTDSHHCLLNFSPPLLTPDFIQLFSQNRASS